MKGLYSMRLSTMSFAAGAVVLVLAGSAFAQTPAQPPKPQTPPAQPPAQPPATTPAPKPPQPPAPLPQDSKIAFVDIQTIASNSSAGKEATKKLQDELQGDFQKKLIPIIEEVAKEKGLYVVFTTDSGVAYMHAGLDISSEVIKRLD